MTFQKKPKPPTLLDKLDSSAELLLKGAFGGSDEGTEGPAVESDAPLPDKIKAFDAVVKWMGERAKLVPNQEKGNSKGERIRSEFHRRTAGRRTDTHDTETPDDDGTESAAAGANGSA